LIHNFLDNELGQLDHKLSQLGIFFTQRLCIGVFAIRPSRARRKRILGTGWQVRTSSKQMSILTEYFPNPLLSFIGTNQIRDCTAYPRPAQNRVHKIKLATTFVFGVDVGARRFRLGTLQIFPNHGKSILATDGMTLEAEELNSGEAAWANLARRLRRDKSGGTYDNSLRLVRLIDLC
jgi:hypothetical protein